MYCTPCLGELAVFRILQVDIIKTLLSRGINASLIDQHNRFDIPLTSPASANTYCFCSFCCYCSVRIITSCCVDLLLDLLLDLLIHCSQDGP